MFSKSAFVSERSSRVLVECDHPTSSRLLMAVQSREGEGGSYFTLLIFDDPGLATTELPTKTLLSALAHGRVTHEPRGDIWPLSKSSSSDLPYSNSYQHHRGFLNLHVH